MAHLGKYYPVAQLLRYRSLDQVSEWPLFLAEQYIVGPDFIGSWSDPSFTPGDLTLDLYNFTPGDSDVTYASEILDYMGHDVRLVLHVDMLDDNMSQAFWADSEVDGVLQLNRPDPAFWNGNYETGQLHNFATSPVMGAVIWPVGNWLYGAVHWP